MISRRIRAYGIVQGVGFRPTVDRHAHTAGISGTVCNKGPYVEMLAQGTAEQVERFVALLRNEPPRRAAILKLDVREAPEAPLYHGFHIVESERTAGEIFVSPDIAICKKCRQELMDPKDLRPHEPPLSASLHKLHVLRPTTHHTRLPAVRPRAHQHGRVPYVSDLRP